MREIKFRAYDKAYERMFTAEILQQASDGLVASANERLDQERRFDNYNRSPGGFFIPTKDENMKIMQYTGLKDKNGKEIYEGDIVKANFFEKHITGKIEFALGAFFVTGSTVSDNQMFIFNDFEVIGNIYDNPELLKGEQN